MQSVYNKILKDITKSSCGSIFTNRDFVKLGSSASIDKALSTLAQNKKLRRLSKGIYDRPVVDARFGQLPPDIDKVIDAIQRQSGDTLQIDGAKAANLLGLSTQVPAQTVYLTDGYSRTIKIGNWIIKLKHASPRRMAGTGQLSGLILQAIRYLGEDSIDSNVISMIKSRLTAKDGKQLRKLIPAAPAWTHGALQSITSGM